MIRAVIDTAGLISYFHLFFEQPSKITAHGLRFIQRAFQNDILLSIPSVVFIEIFDKWICDEEFKAKFYSEVFTPILQSPNIEIKPIDDEVLEQFLLCNDDTINLENH